MAYDLSDYVDVPSRIAEFREKHPEGSLQAEILQSPQEGFIVVKAYAYRSPQDERPGTGLAWEPFPGKTPYTKDSELQNAETSAWGRAIVAVLAADTKRGIASREEIANRQDVAPPRAAPQETGPTDTPPSEGPAPALSVVCKKSPDKSHELIPAPNPEAAKRGLVMCKHCGEAGHRERFEPQESLV